MLVAIGFVIVIACVLGGFVAMGGHLVVTLWQPVEDFDHCRRCRGRHGCQQHPQAF